MPKLRNAGSLAAGLLPLILLALTGCRSIPVRLDDRVATLTDDYREAASLRTNLADTPINWTEALERLESDNLELREARNAIISSEERRRQIYKDLLPGANITANLTRSITDLGNLAASDGTISLVAFVNVPGLIQLRLNIAAATLELVRARWALELRERELTIRLREQFLRATVIEQRHRSLLRSLSWDQGRSPAQTLEADPESLERDTALWALQRDRDTLQNDFAQLLGDNTRRWLPDTAGLPTFDYATTLPDIADTDRYGLLYRQLQAIELEAIWLSEKGVKLQYWPDLRINLAAPPLYSADGNSHTSIDADQVLLNLSSGIPIDIRGNISRQLRETKRRKEILLARMAENRAETLERLAVARESLARNQRRLRLTELRLDSLRDLPAIQSPSKLRENLDRLLKLDEQRANLILEAAQLESLFWLFDETRWTRPDWTAQADN